MKKTFKLTGIFSLLVCLLLFSGCTGSHETQQDEDKLVVYTSIYPMYDFAVKIAGDKAVVTNMVPAGIEPHDWEIGTGDMVNLEQADIFIYSGAGMEPWVDKTVSALENDALIVVEASAGITYREDPDGEEIYDPHVWLSIKNAKIELENIKNAFCEADPEHAEYYQANYEAYAQQFDALDLEYQEQLETLTNRNIIVAHESFGYLCDDYNLTQVAIEGLMADSEPDAARMSEIIAFAKENNVKTIFFEELVSPKVAQTIADELGAETDVLNPLEGLTQEQLDAGEDYLSIMRDNLDALVKALQDNE